MEEEQPIGCARVTSSVSEGSTSQADATPSRKPAEEKQMSVRVGQKAPDFTAPAYRQGKFTSVSLSDFAGKWVLLCFYPGDFTFV